MPQELQAKLLRVLQEKRFRKVGGTKDIPCRATIVASSNRDLPADVKAGRFRRDLYYRLAVFPITIPPLRDAGRRSDVPLLAEFFLANSDIADDPAAGSFSPEAMRKLCEHTWPGNVRELRNVVERAILLERSGQITPGSLVIHESEPGPAGASGKSAVKVDPDDFSLETAEREFILRALRETGWQRTRAAALLGITRATLHAKLKRYDITPPDTAARRQRATQGSSR
jgi:DNA-binding NtrC family response regulator